MYGQTYRKIQMLSRPAGADFPSPPREIGWPLSVDPCEYPRRIRPLFPRRVRIERDIPGGISALEHGCRIAHRRRDSLLNRYRQHSVSHYRRAGEQ